MGKPDRHTSTQRRHEGRYEPRGSILKRLIPSREYGYGPVKRTPIYGGGGGVVKRGGYETKVDKRLKKADMKKLEELLRWLDGLDFADRQQAMASIRRSDSCQWLFDTTQYRIWRDSESSFLWLRGRAGAGKSVLVSSVIDSLWGSQREGEILTFFYCDFRNKRSTNSLEALRSVLCQMLRQLHKSTVDPATLIDDLVKAKANGATWNSVQVLARFISSTARLFIQKPLIVVDALDECRDVKELLEGLLYTREHARIFVSSRPMQVVRDGLCGVPFIPIDVQNEGCSPEFAFFVSKELATSQNLRELDTEFRNEICSVLCRKSRGVSRWVQCSIYMLNRCVSRGEIRKALDNLPQGLDALYERVLLSIDLQTRKGQLVLKILTWLVAALRPLQLDELMESISIDYQTRMMDSDEEPVHSSTLLDACGILVTYVEETNIITLADFTVQEYLTGGISRITLPQYHISWEHAHLQLAQSCMCYISICLKRTLCSSSSKSIEAVSTRMDHQDTSWPLRGYALDHAFDHLRHVGSLIDRALHDVKLLVRDIHEHSGMRSSLPVRCGNPWIPTHFCLLCLAFASTPQ